MKLWSKVSQIFLSFPILATSITNIKSCKIDLSFLANKHSICFPENFQKGIYNSVCLFVFSHPPGKLLRRINAHVEPVNAEMFVTSNSKHLYLYTLGALTIYNAASGKVVQKTDIKVWWCNVLPDASFGQAVFRHWLPGLTCQILCLKEKLLDINIPKQQFEKQTQIINIDVWTHPSQNFSTFRCSKS